jgi:hypothetical protein
VKDFWSDKKYLFTDDTGSIANCVFTIGYYILNISVNKILKKNNLLYLYNSEKEWVI